MEWQPATIEEVKAIIQTDLAKFDDRQLAAFRQYQVEPFLVPIVRYGEPEHVVVVAKRANEVIYWEDIEEGFEVSAVGPEGQVIEHGRNQDDLGIALNRWIEGRERVP